MHVSCVRLLSRVYSSSRGGINSLGIRAGYKMDGSLDGYSFFTMTGKKIGLKVSLNSSKQPAGGVISP